jgi:ATP-binding cassette, subfamily B, bacterial
MMGVLCLLWQEDWRIGLTIGVITIGAIFMMNYLRRISVPDWEQTRQASAELFGFLEERLKATETIRSSDDSTYSFLIILVKGVNDNSDQRENGRNHYHLL